LRATLDFLCDAEAVTGPEPFPTELLDRLRELVPCDFVTYDELDRVEQRGLFFEGCTNLHAARNEDDELDHDILWRLMDPNPICSYHESTLDFRALRLSDFLSRRQLHRNEYYLVLMRPFGVEHQVVVGLPATLRHTKCFLMNSQRRDFDERDLAVLELLRPHLAAHYTAAVARRVAAAIAAGGAVPGELVVISPSGGIDFETEAGRELLVRYFHDGHNGRLPETLDAWRRDQKVRLNGDGALPRPAEPLTVRRDGMQLTVGRLGHMLLLREEPATLTRREREIVDLLAEGRSNAEIASALWIAGGTVRKHLEHIYSKLGVSTRTAALARLRRG
jgi:DNA-binding CsgD family transcriptional regulator